MWNVYTQLFNSNKNSKIKTIGKTSFYYIVNDLISSSKIIFRVIYYVQTLLVKEQIEVLQDVIDCMVHSSLREKLSKYLSAIAQF